MQRAYTPAEILAKKFKLIMWGERWAQAFSQPEITGIWMGIGNSTNGKSSFLFELSKELATCLGKGFYNPYEEGQKKTLQDLIRQSGLDSVNGRMKIRKEPIIATIERASKPKSPHFYVIDSVQAARLKRREYEQILALSEKKLFILVSRADGKKPMGKLAQEIWYDADLKIWVEGYKAISMGRYNAGGEYIIWEQGAAEYWGSKQQQQQ